MAIKRLFFWIICILPGVAFAQPVIERQARTFLTGVARFDSASAPSITTVTFSSEFAGVGSGASPLKLAQQSASTGNVLGWGGSSWTPTQLYYQTVQANGVSATQRATLNFIGSDPIAWTATDNAGKTDVQASINAGSITTAMIEDGTITSTDIASNTIVFADWAQNSATTTNSIPKWNGSAWAAAPDVGATVSNGIINDAGTLKIGGSFPSNRILSGNGRLVISPLTGTTRSELYRSGLIIYDSVGYISRVIGNYNAHQMKNSWTNGVATGTTGMESTEDDGSSFSASLTTGQKRFLTQFNLVNTTPTATSKWEFLSEDTLTASALDQGNMWLKRFSRNTSAAPRLNFVKRKQSGAIATNTFLSSGENMGQLTFSGDETSTKMSATINAYATEAHSTSAQGGKLVLGTTPNGSTSSTDRLTVDQNGDIIAHAYTSARSDTNTIYGVLGVDANGKMIRKSGASLGGDGNGIYSGNGTAPTGVKVTATDSIIYIVDPADRKGNIAIRNSDYNYNVGSLFCISDAQQAKAVYYAPSAQIYTEGVEASTTDDILYGLEAYTYQADVTSPFNKSQAFGIYNYNYEAENDMTLMAGVIGQIYVGEGGGGTIDEVTAFFYDGDIAIENEAHIGVFSASQFGIAHAGYDTVDVMSPVYLKRNNNTGITRDKYNIYFPEWEGRAYNKNYSIYSETKEASYLKGSLHINNATSYVGSDSLSITGPARFVGNIRASEYGVGNKEAADLSKTASNYIAGFATDGTVIEHTQILKASATLDFPNTAGNAVSDLTITVTGAALNDVVAIGVPNGSMTGNGHFMGWVSAADTVTIRFFGGSVGGNPASGTFKVTVTK